MDEPDNSREHAGALIPGAGVDGIGGCTWVLSDPVCRFPFFCVSVIMMAIVTQGEEAGAQKMGRGMGYDWERG